MGLVCLGHPAPLEWFNWAYHVTGFLVGGIDLAAFVRNPAVTPAASE